MIVGYARVPTADQTLDAQLEALRKAGAQKVWREKISGARSDRPQLKKLMASLGKGDTLIITKIDRLARSTRWRTCAGTVACATKAPATSLNIDTRSSSC